MHTFTVVHGVDTSSGVAVVGKCHVIDKRELYVNESKAQRLKMANDKVRIAEITKEQVQELRSKGMTLEAIAFELNCSTTTVQYRLAERG